jgi:hypothetical protein
MTQQRRNIIKSFFLAYSKPNPSQWSDLIDSTLHISQDKATLNEVEVATNDSKYVTPAITNALLQEMVIDASETQKGIVEVATVEEATAMPETILAITPLGMKKVTETYAPVRKVNNFLPVSGDITITNITGNSGSITGTITKSQVTGLTNALFTKIMVLPLNPINLTDGTGYQDTFASINLTANKSYHFKGRLIISTGDVNTHVTAIRWTASIPAAITSMEYVTESFAVGTSGSIVNTSIRAQISGLGGKNIITTNSNAMTVIDFEGKMRCNAASTLAPQIGFSAATGGVDNHVKVGSYMVFTELGGNTMVGL